MNKFLRLLLPQWCIDYGKILFSSFKLWPEYNYWFWKDLKNSSLIRNQKSDLVSLMVTCHVLEKGITMPKRRLGFGYEQVRSIIKKCSDCIELYSENHIEIQSTLKDLEQYIQLHNVANFELPSDILEGVKGIIRYKHYETSECFDCTPDILFKNTNNFCEFAYSRHTCRWFSDEEIDKEVLKKAISIAQTAPSACNRQATKVYVIETKNKIEQVLQLQNGNRGFGHLANKILLITSDMKCWNYKYHDSAFLDGGIFTMNLLYALHYSKICACTLNAHLTINQRKQLKNIVGYCNSEMPLVFIAIGKAPNSFRIAGSQRLETEQIFKCI